MNNELKILIGDTGNCLLYYDFNTTGDGGFLNVAPSSTIGRFTAVPDSATPVPDLYLNEVSGADIAIDKLKIDSFNYELVNPADDKTQLTFIFSFEKKGDKAGVLFGSLYEETAVIGGQTFELGRGFNIGINSRNKLFFQGIGDDGAGYVLTAEKIELANRNICSVSVSPYLFVASVYDLDNDSFSEDVNTYNDIIHNNESGDYFYIGGSQTFYHDDPFEINIDKFLVLSGFYNSTECKSIASGFICTGDVNVTQTTTIQTVTGYEIIPLYTTGYRNSGLGITGTRDIKVPDPNLTEFVVQVTNASLSDGEKFITGYLMSDGEAYLEETAFLVPNYTYDNTGDKAHAMLGLTAQSISVDSYEIESIKHTTVTGTINLYGYVTGQIPYLIQTGSQIQYLTKDTDTEIVVPLGNLRIKSQYSGLYQYDYLYYLAERV